MNTLLHKRSVSVLVVLGTVIGTGVVLRPAAAVTYVSAPIMREAVSVLPTTTNIKTATATAIIAPVTLNNSVQPARAVDRLPVPIEAVTKPVLVSSEPFHDVPFYSQFADITPVQWQKVGCGIASVAMLIDFYSSELISVDGLLEQGIQNNAYLDDAGWIHSGLIDIAKQFGLDGASYSLAHLSRSAAFAELSQVVDAGPVMVSVHYTFQPTNPIPHLAVVTGIDERRVYYNDPADLSGQQSISISQFQSAWKKRYIAIRPAV